MAKVFTNVATLVASLGASENDIIKAVGTAVTENIDLMESDVKSNAPKSGDITPKTGGGAKVVDYNIGSYTFKNYSNRNTSAELGISGEAVDLAAFIEFGTGTDAANYVPRLEDAFQKQAIQFYKNGKGSLAHVPFFIPAWYKIRDKLVADAQKNLDNIKI